MSLESRDFIVSMMALTYAYPMLYHSLLTASLNNRQGLWRQGHCSPGYESQEPFSNNKKFFSELRDFNEA